MWLIIRHCGIRLPGSEFSSGLIFNILDENEAHKLLFHTLLNPEKAKGPDNCLDSVFLLCVKINVEGLMAKKFDGVIEAVRYNPDGQIALVRAYVLRGVTYSDRVLLDRATLLERIKAGKKFTTGHRVKFLASTFEFGRVVKALSTNDKEFLTTREDVPQHDELEETPIF